MLIRFVNAADAAAVLDIYRPFITGSHTSFETNVPTADEFDGRITACIQKYPWLVADARGQIAGYAYATKHRERDAYQWCVETSVYIHPDFYQRGIAKLLYQKLLSLLAAQGFVNAYAGIALPNAASINLHISCGFEEVGIYKKIGFKHGAWHDVQWMVKYLNEHAQNQPVPKGIGSFMHLLG